MFVCEQVCVCVCLCFIMLCKNEYVCFKMYCYTIDFCLSIILCVPHSMIFFLLSCSVKCFESLNALYKFPVTNTMLACV